MQNKKPKLNPLVLGKIIERRIWIVRGMKVMLDSDLADLYNVKTKELNLAVKRNKERFPGEFMFQLNIEEDEILRLQFETSRLKIHGGRRYRPHVFTEQGVAMLSSVLRSQRAIQVNIVIIKIFVRMREMIGSHAGLIKRIETLERKYEGHDLQLHQVFQAIRDLVSPPIRAKRLIGIGRDKATDKKKE